MKILTHRAWMIGIVSLVLGGSATAIEFGQIDDFETDLGGWSEGLSSPNPPEIGGDDTNHYLVNVSSGTQGPGGRMIMFNKSSSWTGDYTAAGVDRIMMDVRNDSDVSPLNVRLSLAGAGSQFSSAASFELEPNSEWQSLTFDLVEAEFSRIAGTADLSAVLGAVAEVRLLSALTPAWIGDSIGATMAVDNILATAIPSSPDCDLNGDGAVDAADAGIMFGDWGGPGSTSPADKNGDGFVDAADAGVMFSQWTGDSASATVPEPHLCGWLLGVGLVSLVRGWRR